jgi:hypothetical protein
MDDNRLAEIAKRFQSFRALSETLMRELDVDIAGASRNTVLIAGEDEEELPSFRSHAR